jgi:hypothetical protein
MKSVGKFLASIAVCCGLLIAVWSLTPATSVATDAGARALTAASISMEGDAQPDVSPSDPDPAHLEDKWPERLEDRCSVSVVVKVPYTGHNASSLDNKDILLARSESMCRLVKESPPKHEGVCQNNPSQKSGFTDPIEFSSIRNSMSARQFRWFCGKTAERSRCRKGTRLVRFRIGPDRLFETECMK